MPIQAFFWDYDNTIFETADAHWHKHRVVLKQHGIELNEILRKRIYENNGYQNWAWMKEELGLKIPQKEYLEAVDGEFQRHMSKLHMRPGVAELIKLINQLGIPQAIITHARRDSAEPVLKAKEIMPLIRFVLFKEDYKGSKPEPTPYLIGIEKMNNMIGKSLNPKESIAIEDDPKGIESAHKAGLIVIQRKLSEDQPDSPDADYCCFHQEDFVRIVKRLLQIRLL